MKIGIPNSNSPKSENRKKDTQNNNIVVKKKKKFDKPVSKGPIVWRDKGDFITAIINRKLIKIDVETFDIWLPNGFKINAKSLDEAKKKAVDFLS